MKVRDSRRLTGPNVIWEHPGAVLDVELEGADTDTVATTWARHARRLLDAVGWGVEALAHRRYPDGVSLALSAPMDALYAATEVAEQAFEATEAEIDGHEPPDSGQVVATLRATIAEEGQPPVLAMRAAAEAHGVMPLSDDDHVSVGLGTGARTWPADAVPAPEDVAWPTVHDIPTALVTGTNGKTTTVRLLTAMVEAAGKVPGSSSTDWIKVGDDTLENGDYSGPGGARTVLRDHRVDVAILETARGGMLRRGLGVPRTDVALVTNVAEDHLGEWGILDLGMLADVKMIVARAARHLVLNADDPELVTRSEGLAVPISWLTLDAHSPPPGPGAVYTLENGALVVHDGDARRDFGTVETMPFTLGGAARHNIANALGAIAVAEQLGLPHDAICRALTTFGRDAEANPGRLNDFDFGGARVLVDFAHNPHGFDALLDTARALPAKRRLVLLGQAGDRDDRALEGLATSVARLRPDRVVLKEMDAYRRGRAEGEIPRILRHALIRSGVPETAIVDDESELAAVRSALAWAQTGDLLLLVTHAERDAVLALMNALGEHDWQPGRPFPD